MKENYWRTEAFNLMKSPYLKYYNKYGRCFYYEKRSENERSTYHKSQLKAWPKLKRAIIADIDDIIEANKKKPYRLAQIITLFLNNRKMEAERLDPIIRDKILVDHLMQDEVLFE
jgi:hypothetical protein